MDIIQPIFHSSTDRRRQSIEQAMDAHLGSYPFAVVDRRGRYADEDSDDTGFTSEEPLRERREPTFSSASEDDETIEYPRSGAVHGMRHLEDFQRSPTPVNLGKHASSSSNLGKHASSSNLGRKHREPSFEYSGMSPGSTVGHHASRMTLGAGGLFENRPRESGRDRRADKENEEYDPERPVEKLVREIEGMHLPRSNIFSKKSPKQESKQTHHQHPQHLGHLAPRHHRPVQPSPLRSLVVPSPDPSIANSKSRSRSARTDRYEDERFHNRDYQARVEDVPDEGTPRRPSKTTSPKTAPPHSQPPQPTPRVRVVSNPETRTIPRDVSFGDMTRLTGMLATPVKGAAHGIVPDDGVEGNNRINDNLKDAVARLHALQDETALSRRRIRELEADLERARAEAVRNQRHADEVEHRNAVLETEKKELEKLVVVLRREVAKVTQEWHAEMEHTKQLQTRIDSAPATGLGDMMDGLLRRIGQLEDEVGRLRSVVERAVELKDATLEEIRVPEEPVRKPTQYQEGLVAAAYDSPHTIKPLTPPPSDEDRPRRRKSRRDTSHVSHDSRSDEPQDDPATSPFPSIRGERLEKEFFSPIKAGVPEKPKTAPSIHDLDHALRNNDTPPQTLVMSVLREIEQDYQHYLGIYTDLADQYKRMSPLSIKRNILAEHLKEVIDTIELKANQVARLTQVLQVKDKLFTAPVIKAAQASKARMSVPETVRAVRKDLGKSIVSTPQPRRRHEHAIV